MIVHVRIEKPSHSESIALDNSRSLQATQFGLLIAVTVPIEFNNEATLGTVEIDDEAGARLLAAPLVSSEFAIAESLPKSGFGGSGLMSKFAGASGEELEMGSRHAST